MPASARRGKQRPGGMWFGTLFVIVGALAIVGVGLYFWSRSSASGTAVAYVETELGVWTSSDRDFAALKKLVTASDVADVEQMESLAQQLGAGGQFGVQSGGEVKVTCEVEKVSVGVSEATAAVKVTMEAGSLSLTPSGNVYLVREGLAWKVNRKRTLEALMSGTPAPPMPGT